MNCGRTPGTFQVNNPEMGTPQPHYIPGYGVWLILQEVLSWLVSVFGKSYFYVTLGRYGGHVPQKQFRDGHTYGATTHGVLMDPCVHASPRSLLNNIHPEKCRVTEIIQSSFYFNSFGT